MMVMQRYDTIRYCVFNVQSETGG